jgi:hypothetical protein
MDYDGVVDKEYLERDLISSAKVGEFLRILDIFRYASDEKIQLNCNVKDADGWTPLMHAANRGHVEAVKVLLNWAADVNAHDGWGNTPLILAAGTGNVEIVRMFLAKGADIWARNNVLSTARMEAEFKGHYDVAHLLRDAEMNSREMAMQAKKLMAPEGRGAGAIGQRAPQQKGRI